MKWIFLVVGLVRGAIGAFATVFYVQMNRHEATDNIVFSHKNYFELGDFRIDISGTLTGPGLANSNNTYSIVCYKERGECWYSSIEQIGENQVGQLQGPSSMPIRKWNEYEVIASDDTYEGPNAWQCQKRPSQSAARLKRPCG